MHIDTAPTSRRRFLFGGAAAAAAVAVGPTLLIACGSGSGPGAASSTTAADDGAAATGSLRVSNWPLYIADGFVAEFQKATGLTVDNEDYNDDEEWFAKNKEPLSRKQDISCDLVIPSETIAARLIRLGCCPRSRSRAGPTRTCSPL
jgi:spermidine/putrescine transport system substrate-binding protein